MCFQFAHILFGPFTTLSTFSHLCSFLMEGRAMYHGDVVITNGHRNRILYSLETLVVQLNAVPNRQG
jgi:hypothetical protein